MTPPAAGDQQQATARRAVRMGGLLVGMGILHFVAPKPFDTIVPAELPGSARLYTHGSGVAEVAVGAALIAPKTRKLGALAAIALYLGVFPANVNMVRLWSQEPAKPLLMRVGAMARLPLQIPMITQAYRVYRNS